MRTDTNKQSATNLHQAFCFKLNILEKRETFILGDNIRFKPFQTNGESLAK